MKIDVSTDFRQVEALFANFPAKVVEQSATFALNRAADAGRVAMQREIVREYTLTASFVRERLRVRAARRAGGRLELQAELAARGRRSLNVIRFLERSTTLAEGRRRRKAGTESRLYVKIRRSGGKKALPRGAFIGNKGRTIFQREGQARLPIKDIATINVPSMFNARRLNLAVQARMRQVFGQRFVYEVERALQRYRRG